MIVALIRVQANVELKKKEVKERTEEMLNGQNKLGLLRRTVRDLQAQLVEIQESKKVAVTGVYVAPICWWLPGACWLGVGVLVYVCGCTVITLRAHAQQGLSDHA
jgi:hypothetical protein